MTSPDRPPWRSAPVVLWTASMAALVLAPLARPGYALVGDMVFTPQQTLLPDALGLGSGLPRAVPADAVVAVLTQVVDGALVQRVALVAALLLAGLGAARLAPGGRWAAAGASTLMIWNPWVAERLALGHWALLLAYGTVPWLVAAGLDVRAARPGARWRVLAWLALASLTPPGAVVALATVLPVVLWPGGRSWLRRATAVLVAALVVQLPWLLPALLHPSSGLSDPRGVEVFAARADTMLGLLVSLLGLGGIWNADAVPASRGTVVAAAFTVAVLVPAVAGYPLLRRAWGVGADGLLAAATVGLLLAAWGAVDAASLARVVEVVPGAGLLRDGQRAIAPLALLLAVTAPVGVGRLAQRVDLGRTRAVAAAGLILLPLVVLPDLAWGVAGRVSPVAYPAGWQQARAALATAGEPGDVVSLPWQTFRRFDWNNPRAVLDPAPRYLDRTTVTATGLPVRLPDGVVEVAGEDPRSEAVDAALRTGQPLVQTMPALGVRWAWVEAGTPGAVAPGLLEGARAVVITPTVTLYRLGTGPLGQAEPDLSRWVPVVAAVDLAVAVTVAGAAIAAAWKPRRSPGSAVTVSLTAG
jgi:hypothetical protein